MKKRIKILIIIIILMIPIISPHCFVKAEERGDQDLDSDEVLAMQEEAEESDSEIEEAVKQEAEVGDADDNVDSDDPEDSKRVKFGSEGETGDEDSDDEEDIEAVDINDPDSILKAADDFVDGDAKTTINLDETNKNANSVYNILLTIGIIISLIWGVVLGIRFIFGSMEGKAEIKKQLIPYIIWVCVIFGSFIIWSVVVNVFQKNF